MPRRADPEEQANEQRQRAPLPDPPAKAVPAPAPHASLTAGGVLALQRSAGNAAVTAMLGGRSPLSRTVTATTAPGPTAPVAGPDAAHHTRAELEAMTLSEFNAFAEAQADWATEPGRPATTPPMPAAFREKLRVLLEFSRESEGGTQPVLAGCGTMIVHDLVATGLGNTVRGKLRRYAQAVAQAHVTVELQQTADVARAQQFGAALIKLEATPGPGVSHAIFKQTGDDSLGKLVDSGFLDDFIAYCRICHPLLEAPGSEIDSYLALRNEGANPIAYHSRLPDVRNYHRFEKNALDRLALNVRHTRKDKPLFLILHSNFDHNGAFHRDPNLTAVITDSRHLTILVEGKETLAEIQSELSPLAHRYGQGDRIEQVMFAGHGNSNVIQMAGTMDAAALGRGETPERSERGQDINSAPGHTAGTDALMHELLANMSTSPNARIVLNGCLTASNAVNGPLDHDPATAARQVTAAIAAQPSLATYLATAAAGTSVGVKGANASFDQVGLEDAGGNLDIIAAGGDDPQLTASKLDYVRGGTEPQGALRAVLEVWASDRLATPVTTTSLDAVRARLAAEPASAEWDARIIQTLYRIVAANPDDADLIRQLGNCAGDLSEANAEEKCRVSAMESVPAAHLATIFTGLMATSLWTSEARVPLVVYQRWLRADATKGANFLATLGTSFTCATARTFVDLPRMSAELPALLPVAHAAAPSSGELKLALLGAAGASVDATSRTFLRAVIGTAPAFPPALGIDGLLGGMRTQADIEVAIGVRGPAATPPTGTPAGPPNNVDLDGDGVNDFRVEPMTRRGAVAASRLNVRRRPDIASDSLDLLPRGSRVDLIGTSGDWYAVEHRPPGTAFVHKDFIDLRPSL